MQLSWLDRLLPLNILLAMVLGTLIGHYVPSAATNLNSGSIADVSVPIFVGLLWMMYPVLCKVKYESLYSILSHQDAKKVILFSLLINVIVAPLIMTGLAWATLPDLPHERTGVIMIGAARCIAMVLIWNQLACGDSEWCAILVAINAFIQLFLYGPVVYFLSVTISGSDGGIVSMWLTVRSVLIFLGIPLAGGMVTRFILRHLTKWEDWYDNKFLPLIGPQALIGLLYTIVVMFVLQGDTIIHNIPNALRTAVPLLLYFAILFTGTLVASLYITKSPYPIAVTQSFTAAGNNFELAIAVAVATYGIDSKEAFSAVIGPLIEVPVLLGLVYLARGAEGFYNRKLVIVLGTSESGSGIESGPAHSEITLGGQGRLPLQPANEFKVSDN
ncbi:arsenite efflux protein-like protein [Rhizoclosmatium globosum]|uniref:Arsenite efflux protein-like protein n=1 Tax=Rhizoclosmatium globosum TaxID=329046 RepID=A0A1Y2CNE8_9FUNG|nr:arsenite efflux protein-like protein [Rhizoclosmatium globosum]|eukprot:ORY48523.1 arsenite efflux protein-like protein [Rhizoclosmatium globosum]